MTTAPRDHAVHFYDDDGGLVESVAEFVGDGLRNGDVGVVVATGDHLKAVQRRLLAAQIDVRAFTADGSLILLDAAATLARLTRHGRPDAARFDAVVGGLVRKAASGGRQVRIYGEMVAVLWDAGDIGGAMELEEMWNGLRDTVPFSLLCGYPLHAHSSHDAVGHVCDAHSAQSRAFPCAIESPGTSRRFVVELLRRWGRTALVEDASLVVAELTANAVVHARSEFVVAVTADGGVVRIAVRDRSPIVPVLRTPPPGQPSGRGLRLIDTLSRSWGSDRIGSGKVVWAELAP